MKTQAQFPFVEPERGGNSCLEFPDDGRQPQSLLCLKLFFLSKLQSTLTTMTYGMKRVMGNLFCLGNYSGKWERAIELILVWWVGVGCVCACGKLELLFCAFQIDPGYLEKLLFFSRNTFQADQDRLTYYPFYLSVSSSCGGFSFLLLFFLLA